MIKKKGNKGGLSLQRYVGQKIVIYDKKTREDGTRYVEEWDFLVEWVDDHEVSLCFRAPSTTWIGRDDASYVSDGSIRRKLEAEWLPIVIDEDSELHDNRGNR